MSSKRSKFEEVEISSHFGIRGPWKSFTEVDAEPDPGVAADASVTAMSSAQPVTRDPGSLTLSTDLGRGESPDEQPPKSQGDPSPPDFVDTYRRYADVYEMPAEVHEAMALALLAAAANGNVWIELGDKRLPLDSWLLITTGSGGGRNTAIKKATFLAHEDLEPSVEWQKTILLKLKECLVFLPLLTDSFTRSD
jgi:hypothetical protein